MKKISYLMAFAVLLTSACQNNVLQEDFTHESTGSHKILTVGMADETDTRVGFNADNSFYWHKGDRIGVITTSGFKEMVLKEQYHRKPSGVFEGYFEEDMGSYVVYPYGGHVLNGDMAQSNKVGCPSKKVGIP